MVTAAAICRLLDSDLRSTSLFHLPNAAIDSEPTFSPFHSGQTPHPMRQKLNQNFSNRVTLS